MEIEQLKIKLKEAEEKKFNNKHEFQFLNKIDKIV